MNTQTNAPKFISLNPKSIQLHPALSLLPQIPVEITDEQAFLADVEQNGVRQPVLVDSQHRLLDGRRRHEAACRVGFDEIDCKVVEDDQAILAILGGFIHRRHLTKSATAYITFPLLEPALDEARQRKLAILRAGGKEHSASMHYGEAKTAEELAANLGVSRRLFFYAKQLHDEIAKDADLQPDIEEAVFIHESGLGAIIAGLAGRKATKGKERPPSRQLDLFVGGWASVAKRFRYWDEFDASERNTALSRIEDLLAETPEDLRDELAKRLQLARKA